MPSLKVGHTYTGEYFTYIEGGSFSSANQIVPFLKSNLNPKSIADFGCGRGACLKIWEREGVSDIIGVDGDYVQTDELHVSKKNFIDMIWKHQLT